MPSRNRCLSGCRRFSIYAEAVCPPDEVYCSGSEDEDYDAPATRRRRYEDAGQRFLSGRVPVLISSSLRGPFEKESGWLNPWRSRRPEARRTEHSAIQAPKASLVSNVMAQPNHDLLNASLECHLPSPESLTQDLIDETHPFLRQEALARVRSWQAQVDVPSLSQDSFWASSKPRVQNSAKKRRAKESTWLKKLNNKKQKTDWSDAPFSSSPLARKQPPRPTSEHGLRAEISSSLSLSPQTASRERDEEQDQDELLGSTRQCSLQSPPAQDSLTTKRVSPMREIRKRAILDSDEAEDEAEDELAHLEGPEATPSSPVSQVMADKALITTHAAALHQDQWQQDTDMNDVQREGNSSSESEKIGPQELAVDASERLNEKSDCLKEQCQPLMCDESSSASTLSELGASPSLPDSARSSTESKPDELQQQCASLIGTHDSRTPETDDVEIDGGLCTQSLRQDENASSVDADQEGESIKSLKPEQQDLEPTCPFSDSVRKQNGPRSASPITVAPCGHTWTAESGTREPNDELSDDDGVSSHVSVSCEAQAQAQLQPKTSLKEPDILSPRLVSPDPQVHLCEPVAVLSLDAVVKTEYDDDLYRICSAGDKSTDAVGSTTSCSAGKDESVTDLTCTLPNDTHESVLSVVSTGTDQGSQDGAACLTQVHSHNQLHDAAIGASQQTPWAKTQMSQLCLISNVEHLQQESSEAPTTSPAVSLEAQSPWFNNGVASSELDLVSGMEDGVEPVYGGQDAGIQQANVSVPCHQRLLTPEPIFSVTPFSAFLSAPPWNKNRHGGRVGLSNDRRSLPSSLKAALKATSSQSRAKNRVSWAPLPEPDAASGLYPASQPGSPKMLCGPLARHGSPPPPVRINELAMSHKSKFSKHFVAVAGRSTGHVLQRLIPTASQQAQLSPGLQAMAETFRAADFSTGDKRARLDAHVASNVSDTLHHQGDAGDGQDQEPLDMAEDVFREMQDFWQS
ncbi:hypothetical protein CDD82_4721 [Ophiocordyceps australis]|uniref:Protamine P1 n=1 Tax=Ophiocordyceps australis TaxID=1399860 RepID=A0A2C5YA18_9HYPO|nr:hypothetical protein CDD82_4721 [Ophiocordyceps australis]